jgi:hypothetical protein
MEIGDYKATESRLRLLFQEERQTRRLISYSILALVPALSPKGGRCMFLKSK